MKTVANVLAGFDLGGSFRSSEEVLDAIRAIDRYSDANIDNDFVGRYQASYRYSHEPSLAAFRESWDLQLGEWSGTAAVDLDLDSQGLATFTIKCEVTGTQEANQLLDGFFSANAVNYRPYLNETLMEGKGESRAAADSDGGLNLISIIEELRATIRPALRLRPAIYFPLDARLVTTSVSEDEGAASRQTRLFLDGRNSVSSGPSLGGVDIEPTPVNARAWNEISLLSADIDAVLAVCESEELEEDVLQCAQAGHRNWFLARTWIGVLEDVGTFTVPEGMVEEELLRSLEDRVIRLSSLEFEIASSLASAGTASVMVRDPRQAQMVDYFGSAFGTDVQTNLLDKRLAAIDRNHSTVAEILDRAHQKTARSQADRLQLLFAGAVAATLTSLIPATAEADGGGLVSTQSVTWVLTGIVWLIFGLAVIYFGRTRIRITKSSLTDSPGSTPDERS